MSAPSEHTGAAAAPITAEVVCERCRGPLPERAPACPRCGAPVAVGAVDPDRWMHHPWMLAAFIFLAAGPLGFWHLWHSRAFGPAGKLAIALLATLEIALLAAFCWWSVSLAIDAWREALR